LFVVHEDLGLNQVRFRRYGTEGQTQHGIDLAGRHPSGRYTVVQCKEYAKFRATNLRAAVKKFAAGKRPFNARHLIVAISTKARDTALDEELARLQDENDDLKIELWGAEQINEILRNRADIVSRFWTRETAHTFCTGAPLPGVPAPPPNWLRMADQILRSPLGVDGLEDQLVAADAQVANNPAAAAEAYGQLADALAADGFDGHSHFLRHKQLDALAAATDNHSVAALAAQLAVKALHEGDMRQAELLKHRLNELSRQHESADGNASSVTSDSTDPLVTHHAKLIEDAVYAADHPLGETTELRTSLCGGPVGISAPAYQPLLVLMLAELTIADATVAPWEDPLVDDPTPSPAKLTIVSARLTELDTLITTALAQLAYSSPLVQDKDVELRLRLIRAYYDEAERTNLLTKARQLRLPRAHAALVLATQARREALDGSADEAREHWRQAVGHAIQDGRTDDARGWLYAIRAVNMRYGPWTPQLDDEHLLAQALPTGTGRLIRRVRNVENDARRAYIAARATDAIRAARRWLADSIVIGDWVDEQEAAELLGDLYAKNSEPDRAAACYQWAGKTKKLTELAVTVGDHLLPSIAIGSGPWWTQETSLACMAAQRDLLDDELATKLLTALLDLVSRARSGEIVQAPNHSLTNQATKTTCLLAERGTEADAEALLNLLAADVARAENRFFHHDKEHVQACLAIITHHPNLVWPAVMRIFDLADTGTDEALKVLSDDDVLELLREPSSERSHRNKSAAHSSVLTTEQRHHLRYRLQSMATAGRFRADVAVAALGGDDHTATERAFAARGRLLARPEPNERTTDFGTQMVSDAYLVSSLTAIEQLPCLEKMLNVAEDRREFALNRQDALDAARNLVIDQDDHIKAQVHTRSREFVEGRQDGSYLDGEVSDPHPLSNFKVDFGSVSMRAVGVRLAQASVVTDEDRQWVRDQAMGMLRSANKREVSASAVSLSRLGPQVVASLDAALLASHHLPVVRYLASFVAAAAPSRYGLVLRALAADTDPKVRTILADRLREALIQGSSDVGAPPPSTIVGEILDVLSEDARHSVRRAAIKARQRIS
jgi:hypothetical protein